MGHYPAFICKNGHCRSSLAHTCTDKFCEKCGAAIISKCPHCGNTIKGRSDDSFGYVGKYTIPSYCKDCGNPYPWTSSAIQATIAILAEDENLSADAHKKIVEILPDVMEETPKSQLAVIRLKKALTSIGKFAAEGLRQFIIDFGCEVVKQQMGL